MHKVFAAYTQMRNQGIEPKTALDRLRSAIMALSQADRHELARYINALESGQIESPRAKLPPQSHTITRPIKRMTATPEAHGGTTRALLETSEIFFSYEYFGANSVLVLRVRGTSEADRGHQYEIRPQDTRRDLILGRSCPNSAPDVDFAPHAAEQRGVSRQHLALRYDAKHNNITVMDLNSANGSFINGRRLYRGEAHVLRNGDELRLGKMILDVSYQHLAEPKPQPQAEVEPPEWLR